MRDKHESTTPPLEGMLVRGAENGIGIGQNIFTGC